MIGGGGGGILQWIFESHNLSTPSRIQKVADQAKQGERNGGSWTMEESMCPPPVLGSYFHTSKAWGYYTGKVQGISVPYTEPTHQHTWEAVEQVCSWNAYHSTYVANKRYYLTLFWVTFSVSPVPSGTSLAFFDSMCTVVSGTVFIVIRLHASDQIKLITVHQRIFDKKQYFLR